MKFLSLLLPLLALMSPAATATQKDVAAEKKWLKYYSERLPEAKLMLRACVTKGFDRIQGEEKVKCEAARDAWHFQPYKPTKK
ncbi:hypothetical protein [Massilia yuzhufengensis]|uniref:hypothetical protein n=1 Tax=Massilia yuzhufengensis TaxID=1164594 RepID=UPI0015A661D3|nr:hypothetical protein [Massilia yuzhufengensis]